MKKLLNFGKPYTLGLIKELLLGLIIIIGFTAFSSAWEETVYCDRDTTGCSRLDRTNCCPVVNSETITCTSEGSIAIVRFHIRENTYGSKSFTCPGTFVDTSDNTYIVAYGSSSGITKGYYVSETNKMPVSALTPAIDGLKGTVVELIPYIIFIGIGMLIATLGFYAIRRLVNWIGGKVNSNFKSKR